MKNLLTDIAGVRVGHADDASLASGVTAIVFDRPAVAAIDVRGGGPGTREDALLDPGNTVERIDAIALAGGSAFGLEAGGGVQAWLAEQGRGFAVRGAVIPIVPGAIPGPVTSIPLAKLASSPALRPLTILLFLVRVPEIVSIEPVGVAAPLNAARGSSDTDRSPRRWPR